MLNIAVTCRGRKEFTAWLDEFRAFGYRTGTDVVEVAFIQFHRITTEIDARGKTFDGVIRLTVLPEHVEEALIACMKEPAA